MGMEDSANSLAWIFFSTTAFVLLSLTYEGIKWIYNQLAPKKKTDADDKTKA
ncbi:MAG: hypothetical protein OEY01_11615 [Desulfobulbaceae bacterium]|nr:hypothetical protein [Desulfobulbaceae bacterium]